jgi:hypothetical protein
MLWDLYEYPGRTVDTRAVRAVVFQHRYIL